MQKIHASQPKYFFKSITNNNGLTHNAVYDIIQDDKGFMWFATEGGLNRYDGKNLKQYYSTKNKRSLPENAIASLVYTTDSRFFVGTVNGLVLYKTETDDFEQLFYKNESLGQIIGLQQGFGSEILISTSNRGALIYNYAKKSFQPLTFLRDFVNNMTIDKEGYYWAFSRFTLYRFNKKNQIVGEYHVGSKLINSAISYMGTDKKGILWVGTYEKGLFTFNFITRSFDPVVLPKDVDMYFIRTVEEGENPNEYWIGTEKGLYNINIKTGSCQQYLQSFDEKNKTINDNAIYKLFRNRQNILFVGTFFGGVNIAKNRYKGFNAIYPNDKPGCLHGKALNSIAKAPDGNLWIATEDAGIAIFDIKNNTFMHLLSNAENPNTISTNNVHALLMDGSYCWAGHFMGGISKIDIRTGKAQRFIQEKTNPSSLIKNFVFALHFLSPDSILVGTVNGMELFDKKTQKFAHFRDTELNGCFIHDIFTTTDGKIWICSYDKGLFILDKKSAGLMTHFQVGDGSGLPNNSIISHCVDFRKRIWLGTRGGGLCLYDAKRKKFSTYNSENRLLNNVVYGILEDEKQCLWVSTNKGISRLNFIDSTSTHFNFKHGIAGNQYNYKSYFKDVDGMMYFGSVTGLTSFKPKDIVTSNEKPTVSFSSFKIFNEIELPNKEGVLERQIDFSEKIRLNTNQNSFTFEFSSVNYFEGDIAYQYYLEGLDEKWSPISENRQASYTNISPGHYVFHIRAINRMSNATGPERKLKIRVLPPFWASWIAFLLYALFATGAVFLILKNRKNRQREKVALAIEKMEKENLNLLHQHKMNFFTNISHEFKTPLSIIIASVEMLFQRNVNQKGEESEIQQSIKRSATKLLFLVNQLMDFRKVESDHAELNITKGNVIDFVNQTMTVYRPLLTKKNIELKIQMSYTETEILIDFDKLEKILTNLMTNAVKYSFQNGIIHFTMNISAAFLEFSVKDTGKGLNDVQKEKIFEAFYSDDFSNNMVESSGIGLALTAGLVKVLQGQITVESEPEKGCMFVVKLPHLPMAETTQAFLKKRTENDIPDILDLAGTSNTDWDKEVSDNKEFTIVLVDDNKDLLMLLQKNFKDLYRVKCFENGKDAWDYIVAKIPDVVITDIMMPLMSGTELCSKMKADIDLCHIPVIMLTAKTTAEAKLEGLKMGADAYVPKPFSMEELDVRIRNILHTRRTLKVKLTEMSRIEGFKIPSVNHEQAFIEKILSLVQENMDNDTLDVHFLAEKLNISRSNLHTKLKNLMEMNTTEFINTVRINKAKELISNTNLSLSEISFKVGYKDAAYFTRVFKKITEKTPGEYRRIN